MRFSQFSGSCGLTCDLNWTPIKQLLGIEWDWNMGYFSWLTLVRLISQGGCASNGLTQVTMSLRIRQCKKHLEAADMAVASWVDIRWHAERTRVNVQCPAGDRRFWAFLVLQSWGCPILPNVWPMPMYHSSTIPVVIINYPSLSSHGRRTDYMYHKDWDKVLQY